MIETFFIDAVAKVGVPSVAMFLMYKIIVFLMDANKQKDKALENNTEALKELSVAVATCPNK